MKTLIINKERLISCFMEQNHVGAIPDQWPYLVAFNPGDDDPIKARVIWASTPSSAGGYFANYRGEENYALSGFFDPEMDYHWGEDVEEIESDIRDFYADNLLDEVDLSTDWSGSSTAYKVEYE